MINLLDATEHLHHEMRSLLELALPCLGSPGGKSRTAVTTTSSSQQGVVPSAPGDGQQAAAAATSDMPIQQGAVLSASEAPVNQMFQPEACHAIAGQSVVMNAESGGQGGGMLSAPWAIVSGIDYSILNLPGTTQGRVSKFITKSLSLHGHVSEKFRIKVWSDEFVDLRFPSA